MNRSSRKKTRRYLLQYLYSSMYEDIDIKIFHASYFDWILDFELDKDYFDTMVDLIIQHENDITYIIKDLAPKFDISAMLKTNVLSICIGLTEMLWLEEEIPSKVSINEAIEIAKYFWDDTSKNIVNGILNSVLENIDRYKKDSWETHDYQEYIFFRNSLQQDKK